MWKTIRSALPNKSGRPSFTKDTDTLANEFNRFFISVGQKSADDSAELAHLHDLPTTPVYLGSTHCDELFDFKAITSEDVRKVIFFFCILLIFCSMLLVIYNTLQVYFKSFKHYY